MRRTLIGLVLDPRCHLATFVLVAVLGARPAREALAKAFPSDLRVHGGWMCCPYCTRKSPPPAPVRWLAALGSLATPGRP